MTEPQQEPTRLQDLCRLRGTPAGLGGSRDKPSTHLEEIRRHLLLHQMALDVLNGALRERLGKEERRVTSPWGQPSRPHAQAGTRAPGTHM